MIDSALDNILWQLSQTASRQVSALAQPTGQGCCSDQGPLHEIHRSASFQYSLGISTVLYFVVGMRHKNNNRVALF